MEINWGRLRNMRGRTPHKKCGLFGNIYIYALLVLFSLLLVLSLASCYSDIDFKPAEITDNTKPSNPSPSNPPSTKPDPGEVIQPGEANPTTYNISKDSSYSRAIALSIINIPDEAKSYIVNLTGTGSTQGNNYQFTVPRDPGVSYINGKILDIPDGYGRILPGTYDLTVRDSNSTENLNNFTGEIITPYVFNVNKPSEVVYRVSSLEENNGKYQLVVANTPYAEKLTVYASTEEGDANGTGECDDLPKNLKSSYNALAKIANSEDKVPFKVLSLKNGSITGVLSQDSYQKENETQDSVFSFNKSAADYKSIVFQYDYPHYEWYRISFENPHLIVSPIPNLQKVELGVYSYQAVVYNVFQDDKVELYFVSSSPNDAKNKDKAINDLIIDPSEKGANIVSINPATPSDGQASFRIEFTEGLMQPENKQVDFYIIAKVTRSGSEEEWTNDEFVNFEIVEPTINISNLDVEDGVDYHRFSISVDDIPKGFDSIRIYGKRGTSSNKQILTADEADFIYSARLSDTESKNRRILSTIITNSSEGMDAEKKIGDGLYTVAVEFGNNLVFEGKKQYFPDRVLRFEKQLVFKVSVEQCHAPRPELSISQQIPYSLLDENRNNNDIYRFNANIKVVLENPGMYKKITVNVYGFTGTNILRNKILSATVTDTDNLSEAKFTTSNFGTGVEAVTIAQETFKSKEEIANNDHDEYGLVIPSYDDENKTLTFGIPNNIYGRFLVEVQTTNNNDKTVSTILDEPLDIYSNQYNIVLLEFTNPTILFAQEYMLEEEYNIPTVLTLERGSNYNWNEITKFNYNDENDVLVDNIYRNPKVLVNDTADQSWGNPEISRLDQERVAAMDEYVGDLVKMQAAHGITDTVYNFFFSDFSPELTLGIVYANGINPDESALKKGPGEWDDNGNMGTKSFVYYLSSGRETYDYIKTIFNKVEYEDQKGTKYELAPIAASVLIENWSKLKDEAKKIGELFTSEYSDSTFAYATQYARFKEFLKNYESYFQNRDDYVDSIYNDGYKLYPYLTYYLFAALCDRNSLWHIDEPRLAHRVIMEANEPDNVSDLVQHLRDDLNKKGYNGIANIKVTNILENVGELFKNHKVKFDKFSKIIGMNEIWNAIMPAKDVTPVLFVGRRGDFKSNFYGSGYDESENPYYLKEYMQITQYLYPNKEREKFAHYYIGNRVDAIENNGEPVNALQNVGSLGSGNWTILNSAIPPEIYAAYFIYCNEDGKNLKIVGYPEYFFFYLPENSEIEYSIVSNFDMESSNPYVSFEERLTNLDNYVNGKLKFIIMRYGSKAEERTVLEGGKPTTKTISELKNLNNSSYLVDSLTGYPIKPGTDDYDTYNYFSVYPVVKNKDGSYRTLSFERANDTYDPASGVLLKDAYSYSNMFGNELKAGTTLNQSEFNRIEFKANKVTGVIDLSPATISNSKGSVKYINEGVKFYNRVILFSDKNDSASEGNYSKNNSTKMFELDDSDNLIVENKLKSDIVNKTYDNMLPICYLERDLDQQNNVQIISSDVGGTITRDFYFDGKKEVFLATDLPKDSIVIVNMPPENVPGVSGSTIFFIGQSNNGRFAFNTLNRKTAEIDESYPALSSSLRMGIYAPMSNTNGFYPLTTRYENVEIGSNQYSIAKMNVYLKKTDKEDFEKLLYMSKENELLTADNMLSIGNYNLGNGSDTGGSKLLIDFYERLNDNGKFEIGIFSSNAADDFSLYGKLSIDKFVSHTKNSTVTEKKVHLFQIDNASNKGCYSDAAGGFTFIPQENDDSYILSFDTEYSDHYFLNLTDGAIGANQYAAGVEIVDGIVSLKTPMRKQTTN